MIKINNKKLNGKTFADICCGIGGFRLAMEESGATCVFSYEKDKHAHRMYETNFGSTPENDLRFLDADDIPDFDILCAGLPNESFIIDGVEEDFRTIVSGTTFYHILRLVHDKLPEIILLESVTKIANDGTLDIIVKALENEDYIVHYDTLNALDYGIPQNRNRLYIVAFRNDIEFKSFSFPAPTNEIKCVADILEPEENIPSELYPNVDDIVMKTDVQVRFNRPIQVAYVRKNSQGERIYSIDGAAIALTGNGGGRFAKTGGIYINGRARKLTSRECARLMGFPDNYVISESNFMTTKLFGNEVVVDVIQAIINEIEYIDSIEPSEIDSVYDVKGRFSEKTFGSDELHEMICSANMLYMNFVGLNAYIWVSYDSLKAEKISIDRDELEQYKNGFIVYIDAHKHDCVWGSVVKSLVDYINRKFNRNFYCYEWYEVELDENERDVFTDYQLLTMFSTCYDFCVKNRSEKEAYLVVVDMDTCKAVRTTKYIEPLEDKYETILIEPMNELSLYDVSDFCKYAIEKHFDIIFEVCMHYNFEIYE